MFGSELSTEAGDQGTPTPLPPGLRTVSPRGMNLGCCYQNSGGGFGTGTTETHCASTLQTSVCTRTPGDWLEWRLIDDVWISNEPQVTLILLVQGPPLDYQATTPCTPQAGWPPLLMTVGPRGEVFLPRHSTSPATLSPPWGLGFHVGRKPTFAPPTGGVDGRELRLVHLVAWALGLLSPAQGEDR